MASKSTTINVDMKKWAGSEVTGPVTLTYSGASPADKGPAGAVVRMLIAQVNNDMPAMERAVTAGTWKMGKPSLPGKEMTADIGKVTEEAADRAIVDVKLNADGNAQEMSMVVVKEEGDWRVDMSATIERLMGVSMEQIGELMTEGMKAMGDAMSTAMQGLGEGLNQAFGGEQSATSDERDEVPTHPDLAAFRQAVIDATGVRWRVEASWFQFPESIDDETGLPEGMLTEVLDSAVKGIERLARSGGQFVAQLEAVRTFTVELGVMEGGLGRIEDRLFYTLRRDEDGRLVPMPPHEFAKALREQLEGVL